MIFIRLAYLVISVSLLASAVRADGLLVKDGDTIAFMGDSITEQGWSQPGGYVKLVTSGLAALGVKIVPIPSGIGGQTSRDMLARFKTDIIDKKPVWLTLNCGVNDVWHGANGVALDEYKKNVTSMVDQAQAAGIKVVILTATVIGEDLPSDNNAKLVPYNDFLRQLAHDRGLPLADENAAFQAALKAGGSVGGLTLDGVHPDPVGHELMAKTLLAALGATPDQLAKADRTWLDAPGDATLNATLAFDMSEPVTLREYQAIRLAASQQKLRTGDLINKLLFDALREVAKAHSADPYDPDMGAFKSEVQKAFQAKIDSLTKP